MIRQDPKPASIVHEARVCDDLRKTLEQAVMLQDSINEILVCITDYPQLTSVICQILI